MNAAIDILGVKVNIEDYISAVETAMRHIDAKEATAYVTLTCADTIVNARRDEAFREIVNRSFLSLPDGISIVWIARLKGVRTLRTNTRGTDFMVQFFGRSAHKHYKHFLYGGKEGVAERLKAVLEERFPGVSIVGTYAPPFRPLTDEEDRKVCETINASGADIVWVGLGAPKQERWMYAHRQTVRAPLMVGVGAAFDFITGAAPEAPRWMRSNGLEWLFRLATEPRRLWRRYLIGNTLLLWWLIQERLTKGRNGKGS